VGRDWGLLLVSHYRVKLVRWLRVDSEVMKDLQVGAGRATDGDAFNDGRNDQE